MRGQKFIISFLYAFSITIILMICIVFSSKSSYVPQKSDCILVLGHSLENGVTPGNWLSERLSQGLELYKSGYANKIILSGKQGPGDNITVAQSMMEWLIQNGANENDIILENNAGSTYENILFSKELLEKNNFNSVIVVTSDFHMFRSMLIAENILENVSGKASNVPPDIRKIAAYVKEPFSIIKDYFRIGRLNK